MKVLLFILSLFPAFSVATPTFTYNTKLGRCFDASGKVGFNAINVPEVFRLDREGTFSTDGKVISNKNVECGDFSNIHFSKILQSGASYVQLRNWNLRGARLANADVSWMAFESGNLDGVNFAEPQVGYTMFRQAHIDRFTRGLTQFCFESAKNHRVFCQM